MQTFPHWAVSVIVAAATMWSSGSTSAQERLEIAPKDIVEADIGNRLQGYPCQSNKDIGYICELDWLDDSVIMRQIYPAFGQERPDQHVGVTRFYLPELLFCEGPDDRILCTTVVGNDSATGTAKDLPQAEEWSAAWSEWVLERRAGLPFEPGSPFGYFEQELGYIFSMSDGAMSFGGHCATPSSTFNAKQSLPEC